MRVCSVKSCEIESFSALLDSDREIYTSHFFANQKECLLHTQNISSLPDNCPGQRLEYADIVFILDGSDSLVGVWSDMIRFVVDVVNSFTIGPEAIRVGLVQFAQRAEVEIALGQINDKRVLTDTIARTTNIGGSSDLRRAAILTTEQFQKFSTRSGANDIVIVLTDGSPTTENQATRDAINDLKREGVAIIPISVSGDFQRSWLELLVNNPGKLPDAPIVEGEDYFVDNQLRQAQATLSALINNRLRLLVTQRCDCLISSGEYVQRPIHTERWRCRCRCRCRFAVVAYCCQCHPRLKLVCNIGIA